MNIGLHQGAEGSIYHPMTSQRLHALEANRHDLDDKVSTAVPCSRVTGVAMTLVDDFEQLRVERCLEPRPYLRDARSTHRSPRLRRAGEGDDPRGCILLIQLRIIGLRMRLFGRRPQRDPNGLGDGHEQQQSGHSEQLEIDPNRL